jgi:hypothetical protein
MNAAPKNNITMVFIVWETSDSAAKIRGTPQSATTKPVNLTNAGHPKI